jgi:hypothetical protein
LSAKPEKVHVQIKYGDVEQQFDAQPQEAWLLVNKFFGQLIPTFEVAKKLQLNIDLQQLATDLNGIVAFSGEGACLLVPKNKLTDNDAILVWLTAQFVGNKLGLTASDALSKDELQTKLAKSSKIVSTRLGELVKSEVIAKTADDKFKITAFGILQAQKEVLPKIKSKINS